MMFNYDKEPTSICNSCCWNLDHLSNQISEQIFLVFHKRSMYHTPSIIHVFILVVWNKHVTVRKICYLELKKTNNNQIKSVTVSSKNEKINKLRLRFLNHLHDSFFIKKLKV